MSLNKRLYYAGQIAGFADYESTPTTFIAGRGIQSAGINTTFNLEQAFELGQLDIYDNMENVPDVEVTLEKVLDGYAPLWTLMTKGATASTLVGRSNERCNIALSIFPDTNSYASGGQVSEVIISGAYPSQISYEVTVDGTAKESVTAVANNKLWHTGGFLFNGATAANGVTSYSPSAPEGVNRRQHFVMASSLWPTDIRGISSSGTNEDTGSGCFTVSIQSVRVSANLGRSQILELGRLAPYFRYVEFPVETTTAIEVINKDGDFVQALETGVYAYGRNVQDQHIKFVMQEGLQVDMGTKNKLNSVSQSGGNAAKGGGNSTLSYNYTGYNSFTVAHPSDPTVALRP